MSYISGTGGVTSGDAGATPADLRRNATRPHTAAHGNTARVVPDLYPGSRPVGQRLTDALAVAALFPPLFVLAVLLDREDRKAGAR